MSILKNAELPVEQMYPKVQRKELIGKNMGATGLSMGEITIEPGGEIPLHYHSMEDCILLRQGSGEVHIEGKVHKVTAPMTLLIEPNLQHKVVNTGNEDIRIIYGFPGVDVDRHLVG
ncbi:MAG: cupin domain-containing protein [Deltaproteobacteria bacterium]|nr:cupin domain-containing protein [Deltaproteobacteria bacterium]